MLAVKLLGNKKLELREFPDPEPVGGDVVVKIHAASICGSDLHGLYTPEGERASIPGHEGSGEVIAIDDAKGVNVGDRVMTLAFHACGVCEWCVQGELSLCDDKRPVVGFGRDGVHAQLVKIPEACLLPLPDFVSYEAAATLLDPVGTNYHALKRMGTNGRHTVAVFGLGPMGLGAVLVASHLGATVIGVDPIEYRREHARKIGACHVLDPAACDVLEGMRDLTSGNGLDMAIECSGTAVALHQALDAVRPKGSVSVVGENSEAKINPSGHFNRKEITLSGSTCFPMSDYAGILRMVEHGMDPASIVTHRFPLKDAEEAYRVFDGGPTGKVILLPEE